MQEGAVIEGKKIEGYMDGSGFWSSRPEVFYKKVLLRVLKIHRKKMYRSLFFNQVAIAEKKLRNKWSPVKFAKF